MPWLQSFAYLASIEMTCEANGIHWYYDWKTAVSALPRTWYLPVEVPFFVYVCSDIKSAQIWHIAKTILLLLDLLLYLHRISRSDFCSENESVREV
jgi:hypothetical protein